MFSCEFREISKVSCMFLSCHLYAFQSESTLYSCLNVKALLSWNRRDIWNLSDCKGTRICNHLVCERTLNHLAKLALYIYIYIYIYIYKFIFKWLSCVVSTYLYGAIDCMFLSCHVRVSWQWTTLYSCLNVKELLARNRRDFWNLSDCKGTQTHNHIVRKRTLNHLAELSGCGFESLCSHF